MIKNKKNIPHQFRNELFITNNNNSVGVASVGGGGVANADLSNYLKLSGESSQIIYGNIGLNTNPTYTLDVSGTFRSNGIARLGATSRIIGTNTIANNFTSALYFRDSTDVGYGEVGHILSSRATVGIYGTTGVGIDFYTNGSTTPKMFINTSGAVGIGTSTLMDYKVNIIGASDTYTQVVATNTDTKAGYILGNDARNYVIRIDGSDGDKFQIRDITANAQRLTITSGGLVGIGTTSPSELLHVYHPTNNAISLFESGDATVILNLKDNTTTGNGYALVRTGDNLGLYTNDTQRLLIDSSGNVGIGTSTLTYKLNIVDAASTYLLVNSTGADTQAGIRLTNDARTWIFRNNGSSSDNLEVVNATSSTIPLVITTGGNVGIGRTPNSYSLEVAGSIYSSEWFRSAGNYGWYNNTYGGGIYMIDSTYVRVYNAKSLYVGNNIVATGEVTAKYTSDERLKSNIKPVNNALDTVINLNPVSFNWNDDAVKLNDTKNKDVINYGLIAQELERVNPELVTSLYDGKYKGVDYIQLIPLLIGAIKEQQELINNLNEKLNNK